MERLLGRPETRRTPRCEHTARDVSTSESQRDRLGKALFCDRVGTVADHEQQFQKSGVPVVTESTAQQVEDCEAALLVLVDLEEGTQPLRGLAPRPGEL
jgi:hypothetical protein